MSTNGQWIHLPTRIAIVHRDGFRCFICAAKRRLTLDHLIPRVYGGSNKPTNLLTLCVSCNSSRKHSKWVPAGAFKQAQKPLDRKEGRRLAELRSPGYMARNRARVNRWRANNREREAIRHKRDRERLLLGTVRKCEF